MLKKLLPLLAAMLLLLCGTAIAEPAVKLTDVKWSWNPEENATFTCTVSGAAADVPEGAVLELYSEDRAGQEFGQAVAVKENGKKISVVKQSGKIGIKMPGGGDYVVECVWHPPDEIGNTHEITLRAELKNASGDVIASGETALSDGVEATAYEIVSAGAERWPILVPLVIGTLTVIIWALAIIRARRFKKNS